ncbi:MAG: hypothetical protein K6F53_06360 [Lachnospiraceae bacterium]|nr:hypothetical protein [Lachnospiraceae bacterium]
MRKILWKSSAVKAVIAILAFVLILSVFPFRAVKKDEVFSVPVTSGTTSSLINMNNSVRQIFFANGDHLDRLRLCVMQGKGDSFFVSLYDAQQKKLAEEDVVLPKKLPAYVDVPIDVDLIHDGVTPYFFKVWVDEGSGTALTVSMEPWGANPDVIAVAYYNDDPLQGFNYAADYTYREPLDVWESLFFIGIVLMAAFALSSLTDLVFRKEEGQERQGILKDRPVSVESVMKHIMNPLAALLIITCITAVFLGKVSLHKLDNGFALFATVLLALILFYAINHDRTGQESVLSAEYLRDHIPDFTQSAAIALSLQACCQYVSGLYDIHHRVAERKEMFWFAFIILAMFSARDLFRLYNLIYLLAASAAGYVYYRKNLVPEMNPDDVFVLRMTVAAAILFGLILIGTVKGLVQKKLAGVNPVYGGILLLYFLSIVIFRNTRWWTVVLAGSFTLLYLNYGMWKKKERFLENLVRGVVLEFIYITCWALMHRPYSTYRSARYTHYFHTATITATYMTTICCVALVLLLSKFYRFRAKEAEKKEGTATGQGRIRRLLSYSWKELLFFGIVSSYLIFTMARTAYAAMLVTALLSFLLTAYGSGGERFKNSLKNACYCIGAILLLLPVVFEVQRTVPALVSDPYTYDIEFYTDDTLRGRKLWSNEYMRVGRFIDVFADKILGLPEGTFDIYGEMEEYRLTHPENSDEALSGALDFAAVPVLSDSGFGEKIPVLSEGLHFSEAGTGEDEYRDEGDYTNGRLDIYRSYLSQMNLTGHDDMGAVLSDGEIATHAHDVYLQVAYDHGIPVGILFVIFGLATLIMGIRYYIAFRDREKYALLPMIITIAFGVAGLVEWVYHLSHPMAFVLLMSITPLIFERFPKRTAAREE